MEWVGITIDSVADITTSGAYSDGIVAKQNGLGAVTITSAGNVTTLSSYSDGLRGIAFNTDNSNDATVNTTGGTITTLSYNSLGIYGVRYGTGAVGITSAADITTSGASSHGIFGLLYDEFEFDGVHTNESGITIDVTGGTINTSGDGSYGIYSLHYDTGAVGITSAADITTSGDDSHGILGFVYDHPDDGVDRANESDITIDVTGGTITTSGDTSNGIFGVHYGTGANVVTVDDGATVIASGAGFHGIRISGGRDNVVRVDGSVTGGSEGGSAINLGASGGSVIIGGTGVVDGTASGAATRFGGALSLDVTGSMFGDVIASDDNDALTLSGDSLVTGDVEFGAGEDTLIFDIDAGRLAAIEGNVSNLEEMFKRGAGVARVRDVQFSASALALEDGELRLRGHLNLGDGTLTVHDLSRLTIEFGDITQDAGDHGFITAGGVVVYLGLDADDKPALFVQLGNDVSEENVEAVQAAIIDGLIDVLGEGTLIMTRADGSLLPVPAQDVDAMTTNRQGTEVIGYVDEEGRLILINGPVKPDDPGPPAPPAPPTGPRDSRDRNDFLIGGSAALLFIMFDLFDLFDDEEDALAAYDADGLRRGGASSFALAPSGHGLEPPGRAGGLTPWVRAFTGEPSVRPADTAATVQGVAMGLDARLGGGFHLGVAAMPQATVASRLDLSSDRPRSSLEGGRYGVRGGWRGRPFSPTSGSRTADTGHRPCSAIPWWAGRWQESTS